MIEFRSYAAYAGVLLIAMLTGCSSSPPTRLYLIEPINVLENLTTETELTIAVGPIMLAQHLDRREVLSHDEPYRLTAAEFDRWAEPLEDNITSVLTENLSTFLSTNRVIDHRWDTRSADYTVRVHIIAFAAEPNGTVSLKAAWTIDDQTGAPGALHKNSYTEPRGDDEVVATVAAMSRAIAQLSRDIADEINELSANSLARGAHNE